VYNTQETEPNSSVSDSHHVLLGNLQSRLVDIEEVQKLALGPWVGEDLIYRFWHQSFKVYTLQDATLRIVNLLESFDPTGKGLHPWFYEIIGEGTNKQFDPEHNKDWTLYTRPIVEAFFHARFFLEMCHKFATELKTAPNILPSGWAALLELYQIR